MGFGKAALDCKNLLKEANGWEDSFVMVSITYAKGKFGVGVSGKLRGAIEKMSKGKSLECPAIMLYIGALSFVGFEFGDDYEPQDAIYGLRNQKGTEFKGHCQCAEHQAIHGLHESLRPRPTFMMSFVTKIQPLSNSKVGDDGKPKVVLRTLPAARCDLCFLQGNHMGMDPTDYIYDKVVSEAVSSDEDFRVMLKQYTMQFTSLKVIGCSI